MNKLKSWSSRGKQFSTSMVAPLVTSLPWPTQLIQCLMSVWVMNTVWENLTRHRWSASDIAELFSMMEERKICRASSLNMVINWVEMFQKPSWIYSFGFLKVFDCKQDSFPLTQRKITAEARRRGDLNKRCIDSKAFFISFAQWKIISKMPNACPVLVEFAIATGLRFLMVLDHVTSVPKWR